MPTYEYLCKRCGKRFERFQSLTAAPLSECPACGGASERQIGAGGGLLFKGDGFHATSGRPDAQGSRPACGRDQPCCGRDRRCEQPSCES